jgi:hypothetical protein
MTLFDFFTSLFVWWYACGLVMLGTKAQTDNIITTCDVVAAFFLGGFAFLILGAVGYLSIVHWKYTLSLLVVLFVIGFAREKVFSRWPEWDMSKFCKVLWRKS